MVQNPLRWSGVDCPPSPSLPVLKILCVTCRQDSKKSWAQHMKRQAAREKKVAARGGGSAREDGGKRGRWQDRDGEGGSAKGGASKVMYSMRYQAARISRQVRVSRQVNLQVSLPANPCRLGG